MKRIFLFSILILAVCSCEDFLEEKPTTSLTELSVYTSEAMAQSAVSGIYGQFLSTQYGNWGRFMIGANSVYMGGNKNVNIVGESKIDVAPWKQCFAQMYSAIGNCNSLIENAQSSDLDKDFVDRICGEAIFLRAFLYFDLVRMYGRIPLVISSAKTIDDAYNARADVKVILAQIVEDFENAFEMMPDKDQQVAGRPHKWAAKAMLGKVYCYMGGMKPEHFRINADKTEEPYTTAEQTQFWTNAYNCLDEVIKSGKYELAECFEDLFYDKVTSRNNCESIFEYQFNGSNSETSNGIVSRQLTKTSEFCPYNGTSNWSSAGACRTTPQVFSRHWRRYGQLDKNGEVIPIETAFANKKASSKMTGVDPRINMTYVYYSYQTVKNDASGNFQKYKGTQTLYPNPTTTSDSEWYFIPIKKHYYPDFNGAGYCNIVMFRYAEVLLLMAEACNELDRPEDAVKYIDIVLRRAKKYREGGMMTSVSSNKWTSNTTPAVYGNIYSDPYATVIDDPNDERSPKLLSPKLAAGKEHLNNKDTLRLRIREEKLFELIGESGEEGFQIRDYGFDYMKEIINYNNNQIKDIQKNYGIAKSEKIWKSEVYSYDVNDEMLLYRILHYNLPLQETSTNVAIVGDTDTYGY